MIKWPETFIRILLAAGILVGISVLEPPDLRRPWVIAIDFLSVALATLALVLPFRRRD